MRKYEIKYAVKEVRKKEDITQGCTISCDGTDYTESTSLTFDSLEEAEEKLKEFETKVKFTEGYYYNFYHVIEYFIKDISNEETRDIMTFTPMNFKNKLYVCANESGDKIEEIESIEQGLKLIAKFESEDKKDGYYKKDFYSIIDEDYKDMLV